MTDPRDHQPLSQHIADLAENNLAGRTFSGPEPWDEWQTAIEARDYAMQRADQLWAEYRQLRHALIVIGDRGELPPLSAQLAMNIAKAALEGKMSGDES